MCILVNIVSFLKEVERGCAFGTHGRDLKRRGRFCDGTREGKGLLNDVVVELR